MDLDITPQPTLGAAVVAMERQGFFTRKGDALRGDIMVPAKVYEAAHAIVLEEQHQQAAADVVRETERGTRPEPEAVEPAQVTPAPILAPVVPVLLPPLPDGAPGSLVARFRAAVPAPETPEAHQLLVRVIRLVQIIARVLGALADLADRFLIHEEDRGRRMAAKLDKDYQLDQARIMRRATKQRLADWEHAHPLLMFLTKKATSEEGKPAAWRTLHRAAETQERRVQEIKSSLRGHRKYLDDFDQEAHVLKEQQAEQKERLGQALGSVQTLNPSSVDTLMSVVRDDERAWVEEVRPAPAASLVEQSEEASLPQLRPANRLRLVPHP